LGATIIAICIILVWAHTVYGVSVRTLHQRQGAPADFAPEQFTFLAGIAAPVEYQNLVTYKASHLVSLLHRLCTVFYTVFCTVFGTVLASS
jgi:hypothetical protein